MIIVHQNSSYLVILIFIPIIKVLALVLVFQSLAGNATGLMVGCAFSDAKVATNVMPVRKYLNK